MGFLGLDPFREMGKQQVKLQILGAGWFTGSFHFKIRSTCNKMNQYIQYMVQYHESTK